MENNFSVPERSVNPEHVDRLDRHALDHLFSVTYEELRRLAAAVRRAHSPATVSPTTMVNEAWLKLSKTPAVAQTSPLHFRRIAACAMRQILIGAARKRNTGKRSSGPAVLISIDETPDVVTFRDDQLLALDSALDELARMNPRQALVVETRFFGGLDTSEIAAVLDISEATILRDWRAARAWLAARLAV